MSFTEEEVAGVQQDWKSIKGKPNGQREFGLRVFRTLFTQYPAYLSFFKKFEGKSLDEVLNSPLLNGHAIRFCSALNGVVAVLDEIDSVEVLLFELGRAHGSRGVTPEHTDKVLVLFEACLKDELGSSMRSPSGWKKLVEAVGKNMALGENAAV